MTERAIAQMSPACGDDQMGGLVPRPAESSGAANVPELQARYEELSRLVAESPTDAELRAQLGYVALELGRRLEAVGAFARALEIDPSLSFLRARLEAIATRDELILFRVRPEVTPYWKDLPGLFAYPIRGRGLGILIMGTVCFSGTILLSSISQFGIFFHWFQMLMGAYLIAYFTRVVKTSGVGQKEPPDWPDVSHPMDIASYLVQWFLVGLASYFPALVILLLPDLAPTIRIALVGMSVVMGVFFYPMALLASSLYGSGMCAFRYPFIARSIMRISREYMLAWACLLLVVILGTLLGIAGNLLGYGVATAGESVGAEGVGYCLGYVASVVLGSGVSIYGYMVFCRLLGQVYFFHQRKLAWFTEG